MFLVEDKIGSMLEGISDATGRNAAGAAPAVEEPIAGAVMTSPFRQWDESAPPNHGEVMRGPCQRKGIDIYNAALLLP